jgi:nicotinamide-nucleotide amidase
MIYELKCILNETLKTISVAESLTGGNLQALLSSVNGSSSFFLGGITAYNIDIKNKFFEIDYEKAKDCDCVSEEVALAMGKGVADLFESNYSISTTGFAVQNDTVKTPYAYICFFNRDEKKSVVKRVESPSTMSRIEFQKYLSSFAIKYFLNEFLGGVN